MKMKDVYFEVSALTFFASVKEVTEVVLNIFLRIELSVAVHFFRFSLLSGTPVLQAQVSP